MALINIKKQVITVMVKVQMKLKIQAVHAIMVVSGEVKKGFAQVIMIVQSKGM